MYMVPAWLVALLACLLVFMHAISCHAMLCRAVLCHTILAKPTHLLTSCHTAVLTTRPAHTVPPPPPHSHYSTRYWGSKEEVPLRACCLHAARTCLPFQSHVHVEHDCCCLVCVKTVWRMCACVLACCCFGGQGAYTYVAARLCACTRLG